MTRHVITIHVQPIPGVADVRVSMRAAAEHAGVHPQTLRSYERHGLLKPERTSGGTRRYSEADLLLACRVTELAARGISLEGVRLVLALEAENARLREEITALQRRHR